MQPAPFVVVVVVAAASAAHAQVGTQAIEADAAREPDGGAAAPVASSAPAERQKLLVLDLSPSDVDQNAVLVVSSAIVQSMSQREDLEVFAAGDLRQMAALEGERQALGCDTSSCLAEIAGAMGARYVVFGSLARLDEGLVVHLSLFDAVEARPVRRAAREAPSAAALARASDTLGDELLVPLGFQPIARPEVPVPVDEGVSLSPLVLGGGALGAAAAVGLVAGAGLLGFGLVGLTDPAAGRAAKDTASLSADASVYVLGISASVALGASALVAVGMMQ